MKIEATKKDLQILAEGYWASCERGRIAALDNVDKMNQWWNRNRLREQLKEMIRDLKKCDLALSRLDR